MIQSLIALHCGRRRGEGKGGRGGFGGAGETEGRGQQLAAGGVGGVREGERGSLRLIEHWCEPLYEPV